MTQQQKDEIAIYRGTMVMCLLPIIQTEIDLMKDAQIFKGKLRAHCNLFMQTLDKEIERLYKDTKEIEQKKYVDFTNRLANDLYKTANTSMMELLKLRASE